MPASSALAPCKPKIGLTLTPPNFCTSTSQENPRQSKSNKHRKPRRDRPPTHLCKNSPNANANERQQPTPALRPRASARCSRGHSSERYLLPSLATFTRFRHPHIQPCGPSTSHGRPGCPADARRGLPSRGSMEATFHETTSYCTSPTHCREPPISRGRFAENVRSQPFNQGSNGGDASSQEGRVCGDIDC